MLFFRKKEGEEIKLEGKESTVSSSDLLHTEEEETTEANEVYTELSFHPDWEVSKEDRYSFQFLNQECPPLQPNQISLSGISLIEEKKNLYRVTAFIRSSLERPVRFEELILVLLDENEKLLGRKNFDLSEVGEIPPLSSRPWVFHFSNKDLFTENLPLEGWKLAFLLTPPEEEVKHALDLEQNWKMALPQEEQEKLEQLVTDLGPPNRGEINFFGLQIKKTENNDLQVTILIRNGSDRDINIEELPLVVEDAAGDTVAKGGFTLPPLTVKANTSKPWTFIFPSSLVLKEDADFSKWRAYAPQV